MTDDLAARALELSRLAYFTISPDGLVVVWNRTAEELYGYGAAEAVGRTADFLCFPGERTALTSAAGGLAGNGGTERHRELLGRVLAQLGDEAAAARSFETALRLLPEELEVRVEYVSLLSKLDRHTEALETLAAVEEAARLDPQVLYLLAYTHAQLGDMEKDRHFTRELASRHPQHSLNQHIQEVLDKSVP